MKQFLSGLIENVIDRSRKMRATGAVAHAGRIAFPPSLDELARELISVKGEASGVAIASELLNRYAVAAADERLAFLRFVSAELGPRRDRVEHAIAAYMNGHATAELEKIHRLSEPRRQELLRRLNLAPAGTAALVRMRENVLDVLADEPGLAALNADFLHLFSSWFNRGFLVMQRIDWTTPANILEKIIRYEAVHEINDWKELRSRLEPGDRRCFAFFHPRLVDEPLIFVEVALTQAIPDAVGPLLSQARDEAATAQPTTAVFYSISNCQKGLAQISFGNFLIKQVVEELKAELPSLKTFVTLSPIPGFRQWFEKQSGTEPVRAAMTALQPIAPGGLKPETLQMPQNLQAELCHAAARYLVSAKTGKRQPIDPVARFHLNNGARLERINWMADASARGWAQSYGLMANYLYDLTTITANHEAYAHEGTFCASKHVLAMSGQLPVS